MGKRPFPKYGLRMPPAQKVIPMTDQSIQPPKPRISLTLPITAVFILLLGLFVAPLVTNSFTEEQLNRNALLSGISFLLIFIAIILFYVALIQLLGAWLNGKVAPDRFQKIEYVFIGGILLGIFGMFQPWVFIFFRYGFFLLILATLGFIAWSHVTPASLIEETAV